MIGIYKITNLLTNEIYIGQGVEVEKRFVCHVKDFENKRNQQKKLIQNINKYGLTNFTFQLIEECSREQLDERETYWISYYDSYNNGLNMTPGGKSFTKIDQSKIKRGGTLGMHWKLSDEARANIKRGVNNSMTEERRKKCGDSHRGKTYDYSKTDTSKMGKGTLGKHRVYDDKDKNIYHYE